MEADTRDPLKMRLSDTGRSQPGGWWNRRKYRDDPGRKTNQLPEQDLDHLGILHGKAIGQDRD